MKKFKALAFTLLTLTPALASAQDFQTAEEVVQSIVDRSLENDRMENKLPITKN